MRYFSTRGYFGAATAVLWAAELCLDIRAEPPGQLEMFISQPSRGYSSQVPPELRSGGELQFLIPEVRRDLIPSDDAIHRALGGHTEGNALTELCPSSQERHKSAHP